MKPGSTGRRDRACWPGPTSCVESAAWTSASSSTARSRISRCAQASSDWETWHLPTLTIVHYGGNEGSDPRLTAQLAYARRLYLRKHGSPARRVPGFVALVLGSALRGVVSRSAQKRACARAALATLLGVRPPPFAAQTARGSPEETDSLPT